MRFVKDKALIINIITMIILIITAICNVIFYDGSKLFRIGLMVVALWLMYFVYKKTFLRKSRIRSIPQSFPPSAPWPTRKLRAMSIPA